MLRRQGWRTLWSVALCAAALSAQGQAKFTSGEPGNVFLAGQAARFTATGAEKTVAVRVTDYLGNIVRRGRFPVKRVDLGALPTGYYELAEEGSETPTPFVVVPQPRPRGEGRLAIDAALSWLVPKERYEEGAELIRRLGMRWTRDRIAWNEVEPQNGKFAWGRYEKSLNAQTKRGLKVYQAFHDIPAWARTDRAMNRFPDDLRDAYQFMQAAGRKFRGRVLAWEIWNEADWYIFATDPPGEYAAFLKAAYYGLKSGDAGALLTQSSMAKPAGTFGEGLLANGTAAFYDLYNYHTYASPKDFAKVAQTHHHHLKQANATQRPLWLTEAGIPQKLENSLFTREQKRIQAEYIPKSYVQSLVNGTTKHFFFVMPHYIENGASYGVLDADLRPYPGYAALATAAEALGEAVYKGQIRFRQPGLNLYVFEDGDQETLVAWTEREELEIPLNLSPTGRRAAQKAQVLNVVGAPTPLNAKGGEALRLPISPSPVYLRLPRGSFADVGLAVAPPAPAPSRLTPETLYGRPEIVVRLRLAEAKPDKEREAYRLPTDRPLTLEVQVYNFGSRAFSGQVALQTGEGVVLSRTSVAIEKLPPMGRAIETVTLTLPARLARTTLAGQAQDTSGERGSPYWTELLPDR